MHSNCLIGRQRPRRGGPYHCMQRGHDISEWLERGVLHYGKFDERGGRHMIFIVFELCLSQCCERRWGPEDRLVLAIDQASTCHFLKDTQLAKLERLVHCFPMTFPVAHN